MGNRKLNQLEKVCRVFRITGKMLGYRLITAGNINTTYRVSFREDGVRSEYIVQRINTYVFKNPEDVMWNIKLITDHIRAKLEKTEVNVNNYVLKFCETEEGKNLYISEDKSAWRVYNFITEAVAYDICNDLSILKASGTAFGRFQNQLADFDASALHVTIPDFHYTPLRLKTFFEHVKEEPCGRVKEIPEELEYIRSMEDTVGQLNDMLAKGEVPLRVTHNDTKTNNVLIHATTNEPLAVIDLDTVMPGIAMHDFGDAVRFAANVAEEDEPDTSKVQLDMERFRAFAEGFIGQTAGALWEKEIEPMALGAVTITVELAVRFLDDYITGDKYFKTNYPGHNLVRARCQLALAKDMMNHLDEMNATVQQIAEVAKAAQKQAAAQA